MKLSIIIPAYCFNELTGKQTIDLADKVLSQIDKEEHELIVVDDGSTYDISELKDRCKYIRLETNQGAATARNTGIDASSGEFINFLDADDTIPDDAVAILADRIKTEEQLVKPNGIVQFKARFEDGFVDYPTVSAIGKLIRRDWIGDDRFDPDQLIGEEDTLFHKEGKTCVINYDPRVIYQHRQSANPDSLMKRFWRGDIPRRKGTNQYAKEFK